MTDGTDTMTVLETDARSRVTLPGTRNNRRYLVREESDGTLILEPAVVMTELERRYLVSGAAARAEEAARHPETRTGRPPRRTPRPSSDSQRPSKGGVA